MLNSIIIMGRLTDEPELRQTQGGTNVASFTVAVERDYGGKDAAKQTDFISCVAWRQTGEFISKYFHKGSMICVEGSLQSRKWEDRDGNKRTSWEVMVNKAHFTGEKAAAGGGETAQRKETFTEDSEYLDGDLPF